MKNGRASLNRMVHCECLLEAFETFDFKFPADGGGSRQARSSQWEIKVNF